MMPPKCYTWLESCGSQLSDGKNEKLFFCILQSVGFSMTLRTDIFLYTEKLSYIIHHKDKYWILMIQVSFLFSRTSVLNLVLLYLLSQVIPAKHFLQSDQGRERRKNLLLPENTFPSISNRGDFEILAHRGINP